MKKYKLQNRRRFYATVAMMVFILSLTFMTVLYHPKAQGETLSAYKTVIVDYGDTIWDIAQKYNDNSNQDMRMFVYNIEKVNGLKGEMIKPGQVLRIPQGE